MENKTSKKYDILMIVWGLSFFIQQSYKQKLENKNKIMRNRHLALLCSIISITIMFFILWCVEMSRESDASLFSIIVLTIINNFTCYCFVY